MTVANREAVAAASENANSQAMATSGSRSQRRRTMSGGRCRTRHDPAYFRHQLVGAGALYGGDARDPRMLLGGLLDPRRMIRDEYLIGQGGPLPASAPIPIRRQRHRRLGGSCPLPAAPPPFLADPYSRRQSLQSTLAQRFDFALIQMFAQPSAEPRAAHLSPEREGKQLAS